MSEKTWPIVYLGVQKLGTFQQHAAQIIHAGCHYSWYWVDDDKSTWEEKALTDCNERVAGIDEERERLAAVQAELTRIINERKAREEGLT